jgi:alkyl sulfatase BDS1-like metallo-beta-lactamase superfamily hydrolase
MEQVQRSGEPTPRLVRRGGQLSAHHGHYDCQERLFQVRQLYETN